MSIMRKLLWPSHQSELLSSAKLLCDAHRFVDLTIYCEDGAVRAHQMLLAAASPFLKLLFQTSPMYAVDEIAIVLPEVKTCLVQALVHLVYTGTVITKEDHFYSLMQLVYALNINVSIEAESTHERPTAFTAPQMRRKSSSNGTASVGLTPNSALLHQQSAVHQGSHQLVALPSHPLPPPTAAKSSAAPAPASRAQHTPQHKMNAIQLPTQPVPLGLTTHNNNNNPSNGNVNGLKTSEVGAMVTSGGSYIAVDPNTGLSYKVEVPNGPVVSMGASNAVAVATGQGTSDSDPLAAIMNETIFTENASGHSGGAVYANENGQLIYATASAAAQVVPSSGSSTTTSSLSDKTRKGGKKGKKRKEAAGSNMAPREKQARHILAESVENLPCAPDDEDLNTPYPCDQCNKSIKGRIMLQAHKFQEHYDNPDFEKLELGDKHACRVCLKLFTRNSDVKAHILRVHCGDRRYPCTMCGKRFKESTHLRKHLYTHTGERPHYCSLCGKGFQTSSDLKRHKRTRVHLEKVEQSGGNTERWKGSDDDDEDDDDEDDGEAHNNASPVKHTDATAQALISSITQPVVPHHHHHHPDGIPDFVAVSSVSPQATTSSIATPPANSSTIDMKALSVPHTSGWNNNGGNSLNTASSTLDLKALGTVPQCLNPTTSDMQSSTAMKMGSRPNKFIGGLTKRAPSMESPSQEDNALTVVENDSGVADTNALTREVLVKK